MLFLDVRVLCCCVVSLLYGLLVCRVDVALVGVVFFVMLMGWIDVLCVCLCVVCLCCMLLMICVLRLVLVRCWFG